MTGGSCGKTIEARNRGCLSSGRWGRDEKTPLDAATAVVVVSCARRKPPSRAVSAQYDRQTGGWWTTTAAADLGRLAVGRRSSEHVLCPKKRDQNPASGRRYRRKTVAGVWAERAQRRSGGRTGGRTTDLRETRRGDERRCHGVAGEWRGEVKKNHTTEYAAADRTGARRCCQWVTSTATAAAAFVRESCLPRRHLARPSFRSTRPMRIIIIFSVQADEILYYHCYYYYYSAGVAILPVGDFFFPRVLFATSRRRTQMWGVCGDTAQTIYILYIIINLQRKYIKKYYINVMVLYDATIEFFASIVNHVIKSPDIVCIMTYIYNGQTWNHFHTWTIK